MNPLVFNAPSVVPGNDHLPVTNLSNALPLCPPRKTELPYTADEYRRLPDDQKSPLMSFLLEGKSVSEFRSSLHLDVSDPPDIEEIESENKKIIEWCVCNDEAETLEFFFEQNPMVDFFIDPNWPSDKLISVSMKILDVYPKLGVELSSISFEPKIFHFLCRLVSDSRVVGLVMDASGASDEDLLKLMTAMQNSLRISQAELIGLNLTEETEQAFAFFLADNKALLSLQIYQTNFGPTGGANIFNALAGNKVLQKLILDQVIFSNNYQHGLGHMLEKNNCLTTLGVSCQNFGPGGVKNILKGAQKNTSLEVLILDSEVNQPDAALELIKFIALNKPIRALMVTCNPLSDDEKMNLIGAMYRNKSLCDLEWFTEDQREAYEADLVTQFVFKVLNDNRNIRDTAILNQTSRNFSDKPFDSRAYLPEEPAQMIIDNLWQLSNSKSDFEATAAELSLTLKAVEKQEEARKKEASQRKSQDSSNTSTNTDWSSSSSSAVRKGS